MPPQSCNYEWESQDLNLGVYPRENKVNAMNAVSVIDNRLSVNSLLIILLVSNH